MANVFQMDLRCSARRSDEEQGSSVIFAMRIVGSSLAANNPHTAVLVLGALPPCRAC